MRWLFATLLFTLFVTGPVFGQREGSPASVSSVDTIPPEPSLSERQLALHYINLDWTPGQWGQLAGRPLSLVFYVDAIGEPFLSSAFGNLDSIMFDSLAAATVRLPYFVPAQVDENTVDGVYEITFAFPRAFASDEPINPFLFMEPPVAVSREELDTGYVYQRTGFFMDFNIIAVDHLGTVGTYLKTGGGLTMHIGGHWSDKLGATMSLGVELNGRRKPFPDDPFPNRDDNSGSGVWLGGALDYVLRQNTNRSTSIRPEIGYGQLNAANRLEPQDELGWVAYRGVHLGLSLSHTIRLGRYKPNLGKNPVTARFNGLNVVGGLRYRYFGNDQGRGAFWFLGVGYRLGRGDFMERYSLTT